jgi:hypothetical protein
MKRQLLILSLAIAATLIPSARMLANPDFHLPAHYSCDKKLADTITALEKAGWQANTCYDFRAAEALYADQYVEVLQDGSLYTKKQLVQDLRAHAWVVTSFEMSEICVVRLSESSALIRYRITAGFDFGDGVVYTFDLRVTSTYAQVWGQWKGFSYQETNITPPPEE